jgi:hypothetical protein
MRRVVFAVLVAALALPAGGCTRTSDGSIELTRPTLPRLSLPRLGFGSRRHQPAAFPAPPAPPVEAEVAAASPQPDQVRPSKRKPKPRLQRVAQAEKRRVVQADGSAPDLNRKGLYCHNETGESGRIKVVCE